MSQMNEMQLKQQLKDLIGGRNVKAALFYTFNFSPRFFENYVMPLLVPSQRFINNEIANHIVWRNLYKDQRVPHITVYFDHDVKDAESGPMLQYDFVAVSMAGIGHNKGNFHPKNTFILVENDQGEEELIVLTGSNNITQAGWCENLECVAQAVISQGKYYPQSLCNSFKQFIQITHDTFAHADITPAEMQILRALNKYQATQQHAPLLYHSLNGNESFEAFLEQEVFEKDTIKLVEIQSPYFSNDTKLVGHLKNRGIKIHIQAPLRNGVMQLKEDVFDAYSNEGVTWYYPDNEERNNHRKLYRFHGQKRTYTIIGSVNFTQPAWRAYSQKPKEVFNIESALLFEHKATINDRLLKKPLKAHQFRFEEAIISDETRFEREEIPEIHFQMDWSKRVLTWTSKAKNPCKLSLDGGLEAEVSKTGYLEIPDTKLGNAILDALARKSIIAVEETKGTQTLTHYYYMTQSGFGQRPSQFRITPSDVIDAWELLGNDQELMRDWFDNTIERLVDLMQDESGKITDKPSEKQSLLNDMSRHFFGLAHLEQNLFDESKLKAAQKIKNKHYITLEYYLTHDNVDTLLNYLRGLEKSHMEGNLMHSYYWLLLQIVKTRFYEHPALKNTIRTCASDGVASYRAIRPVLHQRMRLIDEMINKVADSLELDPRLIAWTRENLQPDGVS
jgi:HKD family nuclease